ncbi:hypothetical protein HS961_06990 [Comamonas piscis]|uniref:Uncharacterized protein n=1 Tax=Comamonas piscis TaxID=1562974 RepID=A0A7G5EF31_9BURK|nr:hypothetical protein [Comamonas piscis]QMV72606.1 hypothetical protein HS961_06990 [Comamonas piscis]WSO35377.1 hypothetical protein VUJ63_07015 [Comamonas piscis]
MEFVLASLIQHARNTRGLFYWSLMEVHNPIARAAAKLRQHGHEAEAKTLKTLPRISGFLKR